MSVEGVGRRWGGWDVSPRIAALVALARGAAPADRIRRRVVRTGVPLADSSLYAALGRLREEGLAEREAADGGRAPARWCLTAAGVEAARGEADRLDRLAALGRVPGVWVIRNVHGRYLTVGGEVAEWGFRGAAIRYESRGEAVAVLEKLGRGVVVGLRRRGTCPGRQARGAEGGAGVVGPGRGAAWGS
jgi:DNA-binding PadR family transcriptional regulator